LLNLFLASLLKIEDGAMSNTQIFPSSPTTCFVAWAARVGLAATLPVKLDFDAMVAFAGIGVRRAVGQAGDECGLGGHNGRRQTRRNDGHGLRVATIQRDGTDRAELFVIAAVLGLALRVAGSFKAGLDVVGNYFNRHP